MPRKTVKKRFNKYTHKRTRKMTITPKVYKFQRTQMIDGWTTNGLFKEYTLKFELDYLPDYAEFVNLFDAYRITGVKITFIPLINAADVSGSLSLYTIGTCPDLNNASPFGDEDHFWQHQGFKYRRFDKPFSLFLRPKTASSVYGNVGFTSYAQSVGNPWIDSTCEQVEYYGLRYYIHNASGTAEGVTNQDKYKIAIRYYIECKEVQ